MASRPRRSTSTPPALDQPDVEIGRTLDGRGYVMPKGWRRLPGETRTALLEVQDIAARLAVLEEQLDAAVPEARLLGASWGQLGVAARLTPEGARRRWSDAADDLSRTLGSALD